ESGKMDKNVTVSENAIRAEGSSIYLKPGEKIKLSDLVYGLMLRSGNDSAVTIAEAVGGSMEGFVFLMNQKAREIGMKDYHFSNPHGLDDHENHYSTAYDMALLTRYAMKNEVYRKISSSKNHRAPNPSEKWDRVWKNKNRLLSMYKYCTGGKTGYTKRAKRTLVSTATKGDMSLIAVTLNDPNDWNDHISMYENGFDSFDMAEVVSKGDIEIKKNPYSKGKLYLKRSIVYPATSEEMKDFKVKYELIKVRRGALNVSKGSKIVGKAVVYFEGKRIQAAPIYYTSMKKGNESKGILDYFKNMFLTIFGVNRNG
ncbi:MAG: D-alanyl-D-alanine carboxypeptidase family protein, partial [Bacillota bacterium]|nr:D-alanyl-D-alanine carboxypeptidase family protein [Bacillota bacterium]